MASWYGEPFHGRATANGEVFDRDALTAAHPTLPLPSIVRVTNLANRRQLELRVNDRGPFVGDRLIDLSQARGPRARLRAPGPGPGARRVRGLAEAKGVPPRPRVRAPALGRDGAPVPAAAAPVAGRAAPAGPVRAAASSRSAPSPSPSAPGRRRRSCIGTAAAPVSTQRLTSDPLTRVRLGPIADPAAAAATLDQLKRSGYAGAFIVGRPTARVGTPRADGAARATELIPRVGQPREESMVTRLWSVGRSILALLVLLALLARRCRARRVRDAGAGGDPARSARPIRSCSPRIPTSRCRPPR